MSKCPGGKVYLNKIAESGVEDVHFQSIISVDYVLIQSGRSLPKYELTPANTVRKTKNVLFDAGTSRFDSSLFWFTCAFSQVLLVPGNK